MLYLNMCDIYAVFTHFLQSGVTQNPCIDRLKDALFQGLCFGLLILCVGVCIFLSLSLSIQTLSSRWTNSGLSLWHHSPEINWWIVQK